jgi:hypothetical protein
MTAKAPTETHPIYASHLGVSKSKAESETRTQPAASATWMATADPLPTNTWVNTAMGSANNSTRDPNNPRVDRTPEPLDVSRCGATLGVVPAPAGAPLRG